MKAPGPRMEIAVYCPHYEDMGGVQEVVRRLTSGMVERRHAVTIIGRSRPDAAPRALDPVTGAALWRTPLPRAPFRGAGLTPHRRFLRRFPSSALRLVRAIRASRPQLIATHCSKFHAPYVLAMRAAVRVPIVVHLHNGPRTADGPESRSLTRLLLRCARRVLAVSAPVAEYARDCAPAHAERVVVVPNGIDPEEFGEVAPARREQPFVLGVGRLAEQKGFDILIDALADTDLDLLLAGDGPERGRLAARAGARGVTARVQFLGMVDRSTVASLLRGAAMVAIPSRFEGHPLVCLEAMLNGAPVIAAAIPGLPAELVHGRTGILVRPEDPEALGRAMASLAAAPERAAALGRAAREAARTFPDWSEVTTRVLEEYRGALGTSVT